nr:hypothetical protein BaRGS_023687 [Batillaria attramentaria]
MFQAPLQYQDRAHSTLPVVNIPALTRPGNYGTCGKREKFDKEPCNITRQALEWNPQGKRKRGRPKQTWRRSLHCELRDSGLTWEEAKTCARDRLQWCSCHKYPGINQARELRHLRSRRLELIQEIG